MKPQLDVVVVASERRPAIITGYLRSALRRRTRVTSRVFMTTDHPKPDTPESPRAKVLRLPQGAGPYRCFRGHQEALAASMAAVDAPAILVLEDDALPIERSWMQIVLTSLPMLEHFEVVSLHGRYQTNVVGHTDHRGIRFNELAPIDKGGVQMVWQLGALAYLVNRATAAKICALQWDGYPIDLVICNDFSFRVMQSSPFQHDRRHGSLVETA